MEKFWDFSFTEMAKFDLPATIEEIHSKTRQKISIIGYSEGGLVTAICCSQDYQNISSKIEQVIGLGPILSFKSSKGQWSKIAKATSKMSYEKVNKEFSSSKGMKNLFPLLPEFVKN